MRRTLWALAFLCGCGALGSVATPEGNLPSSGTAPFTPLEPMPGDRIDAPVVLSALGTDFDDPAPLMQKGAVELWLTSVRAQAVTIVHTQMQKLADGFSSPERALEADQDWEQGQVRSPTVLAGSPWFLFYAAGDAIGLATSADGKTWQKAEAPVLTANHAGEGDSLHFPSAVRDGDRVRLYYSAAGAVWAAEAAFTDLETRSVPTFSRLDGNPSTAVRDPMLAGAPYAIEIGRPFARLEKTPTGRNRTDLYFGATLTRATASSDATTNCGVAASFSGYNFAVSASPILAARPATDSPAVVLFSNQLLLLYRQQASGHYAIAAAM